MRSLNGTSSRRDGGGAVAEATQGWPLDAVPDVVFVFVSTAQSAEDVAAHAAARFPRSTIVGCTTTGEMCDGRHARGSVVLSALLETGITWSVEVVEAIDVAPPEAVDAAVRRMLGRFDVKEEERDSAEFFCLSLIDGLRGREEVITAQVADALEGIRLVGGSAGDDLGFRETKIIHGGRAFTNGLLLLCAHAKDRFAILKHQHFLTTERRLAITKVDTASRRVYEIDGMPAMQAYALALGLDRAEMTSDVTFMNPFTFTCSGEIYVRSVQKVHEDDSITFFCGIDEGMVLGVGGHHDMVASLDAAVDDAVAKGGPYDYMLGFNCILRALEAEKVGQSAALGDAWRRVARSSVGFDTYGEQLDGLHINQTLVAVMLRSQP